MGEDDDLYLTNIASRSGVKMREGGRLLVCLVQFSEICDMERNFYLLETCVTGYFITEVILGERVWSKPCFSCAYGVKIGSKVTLRVLMNGTFVLLIIYEENLSVVIRITGIYQERLDMLLMVSLFESLNVFMFVHDHCLNRLNRIVYDYILIIIW